MHTKCKLIKWFIYQSSSITHYRLFTNILYSDLDALCWKVFLGSHYLTWYEVHCLLRNYKVITWSVFRKCRSYYAVLGVATDSILLKCFGIKVLNMKFPQFRNTDKPIDMFVGMSLCYFSNYISLNKYVYIFVWKLPFNFERSFFSFNLFYLNTPSYV